MKKQNIRIPRLTDKSISRKYFIFLFVCMVLFVASGFFVNKVFAEENITFTEVPADDITGEATWALIGSPYVVNQDVTVAEGATLTIEPGVVVKLSNGASIIVDGKIEAEGTTDALIYFTSNNDDFRGSTDDDTESCNPVLDEEGSPTEEEPICENVDQEPSKGDWGMLFLDSETEQSVFNNVVSRYSDNDGLFLSNGASVTSDNFNTDSDIITFGSSSTFAKLTATSIELINGSDVSIENSTISNPTDSAIYVHDNSSLNLKNSKVEGVESYLIYIFDNSNAIFDTVEILGSTSGGTVAGVFSNSTLEVSNSNITSTEGDGFEVFEDSYLTLLDTSISCKGNGISVSQNANLNFSGGSVSCLNDGLSLHDEAKANITGVKISDAMDAGIIAYNNTDLDPITITKSEITGNNYGFFVFNTNFSAHQNSIHDNLSEGAFTYPPWAPEGETPPVYNLDFTNNYWGDPSGPIHSSNLPGLGDTISDGISYSPFLTADPLIVTGLSNIMFIPGFQGSRLYRTNKILGLDYEDRLWETDASGDIPDLYMDGNGESIDKGIYAKDIIDKANALGVNTFNIYDSFMNKLDEMVSKDEIIPDGKIAAWKAVPYDWRFSPLDIVNRGIEKENGNIYYTEKLVEGQVPYIIDQLQKLHDSSATGNVSIITHSNGGLVAEALIAKLVEMKNNGESDLIDYIDNLIMVAPPLLGTPSATVGILHGYDQGKAKDILLGRKKAREFGQNVPGAYGLIPSEKYTSDVNKDLIVFENSVDQVNNWRTKYGDVIDSFSKFENFLLDTENTRTQPSYDDLVNPTILNENIVNKANELHNAIDNLEIPSNIKVSQVAGFGLPTAYSFHYKSKSECLLFGKYLCLKNTKTLASDLIFTSDGDKTVVSGSALYGKGDEYYLNLNEYNNKYSDKDHADIFEVPYLFDLINNLLNKNIELPEYVTSNKPAPINYTVLTMRSPVAMDIYNEEGLHAGAEEQAIPNSIYTEVGSDKYLIVPSDGDYRLELTGLDEGIFTLEQQQIINDVSGESVVFRNIPTTPQLRGELNINANELATNLSLDQDNDGNFETDVTPTDLSLAEDFDNGIIQSSSASGSLPFKFTLPIINESLISTDFIKDDYSNKSEENSNTKTKINISRKGIVMGANIIKESEKINISQENNHFTPTDSENNINPNILKLIIVGAFVLLLLSLKYIFKLI